MIRTKCRHCGAKYNVAADSVGKKLRCKECEASFIVKDINGADVSKSDQGFRSAGSMRKRPAAKRDTDDSQERPPRRKRQAEEDDSRPRGRRESDDEGARRQRRSAHNPEQKSALPWIIGGSAGGGVLLLLIVVVIIVASSRPTVPSPQPVGPVAANPNPDPADPNVPPGDPNEEDAKPPDQIPQVKIPIIIDQQPAPNKPVPPAPGLLVPASRRIELSKFINNQELKVTPGSKYAAISYYDNAQTPSRHYITVLDLEKGAEVRRLEVPKGGPLRTIDISADGAYVAALRSDFSETNVLIWSLPDGTLLSEKWCPFPKGGVLAGKGSTAFLLPNKELATVSMLGQVRFWSIESKQMLGETPPLQNVMHDPETCVLSPSQRLLAILDSAGKRVLCIDVAKKAILSVTVPFHDTEETVSGIGAATAFSPDEKSLAVCWKYSTKKREAHMGIALFNVSSGERVFADTRYHNVCSGLGWHSQRYICLWTGKSRKDALLFDTERKQIVQLVRSAEPSGKCATSPDGHFWYLALLENKAWSLQMTTLPENVITSRTVGEVKNLGHLPKLYLVPEGIKSEIRLPSSIGGPLLWD